MLFDKTPLYAIFIIYLIIGGNFMAQLFPCRLQHLLNTNMIAKNVAGFLTLLFFVVIAGNQQYSFKEIWIYSIVIYIVFMASTRMSLVPFYFFMTICCALYVVQLYEVNNSGKDVDKVDVTELKLWLTVIAMIVLIMGVIMYILEKKYEYSKQFSYKEFLLGKPVCRHSTPPMSLRKILSATKTH
jgi:hypothetical protein